MENMTLRIVYLVFLGSLGWYFSPNINVVAMRRSIFDFQTWSIWLGILPAALTHLVGIGAGILSKGRPAVWLIYIGIEAVILVALLILYSALIRKPYAVLGFSFYQLPRQLVMGFRWILGYFIIGNASLFLVSFISVIVLKLPAILESVILRQRQTMRGGGVLLDLIDTEFGSGWLWVPVLFLVLIGPLLEELVFRGFLYGPIRRRVGSNIAIFLTAMLFMLGHGHIGLYTFVFGLLFAYLYESTQSLVPGFLFHVLLNLKIVQFYIARHEPFQAEVEMVEAGWRTFFYASMFVVVFILHRKMSKRGKNLPLPLSL